MLFACSGDVAWDLGLENERDHKFLRVNAFCAVGNVGGSLTRCAAAPRVDTRKNVAPAATVDDPSSESFGFCGTLLSLGCLLSV